MRIYIHLIFTLLLMSIASSCSSNDADNTNIDINKESNKNIKESAVRETEAHNTLTHDEFIKIQKFYDMRPEYVTVRVRYREKLAELIPDMYKISPTSADALRKYKPVIEKLDEEFAPLNNELYRKYGLTKDQFVEIASMLLKNPGKTELFKKMRGRIPEVKPASTAPSKSYRERLAAAGITIDLSNPGVIRNALNKEGSGIQLDVIKALGDTKDPAAAKYLVGYLESEIPFVKIASAESLCKLGLNDGIIALVNTLRFKDQIELYGIAAINAMRSCGNSEEIEKALIESLRDEKHKNTRLYAAMEFQKRSKQEYLVELKEISQNETDESVKMTNEKTIRLLENLGNSDK